MIYIELKRKHNEKIDEIEEKRLQEFMEEKERHEREKKTLEHDLTLLHWNLDVESKFSKDLALENHRLQDQHEKFRNQVDIERIKTQVDVLDTYETHGIRTGPYVPDNKLNVKTEILEMQKNWAELEKETADVNTGVRHLIRSTVAPYSH